MLTPVQLQAMLDHLNQALLLVNAQGQIEISNSRLESLLGVPSLELAGLPLIRLLEHPTWMQQLGFEADDINRLVYQLQTGDWSSQSQGADYHLEQPYARDIHRSHVLLPADNQQVTGLLLLYSDITASREAQSSQGQMMSMIVHDLRSPLSAITSSMRLLQDSADPQTEFGQSVLRMSDISGRAARKLLTLVNSLLDVVKMESGIISLEREKVNLEHLLTNVLSELTPMANEMDVQLQVSNIAPSPLLYVDPDKIERVFYNLLDNAIKFSPSDSTVRIEGHSSTNGFLRVNVIDQGLGIRDEDKTKLFNRFQQVEEQLARRRGTGLGLTFCKLAIEAHGGSIWIEDNATGGSIFAFTLPLKK